MAAHGITACSMFWPAVARAMPSEWSLVAVDLRGRGHSNTLPGPFGMRRHTADLNRVAEQLGGPAPVLVGHSTGAYVAVRAVAARTDLWHRLVLVDGGLPLPLPACADPDHVLEATLGPALERLRMTFPSEQAYLDVFHAHPALGPFWNEDIEAYVRNDLTGEPGALRSRNNEQAVREDGRDLLVDAEGCAEALRALRAPTTLLLATGGMLGRPPGPLPEAVVAHWRQELPSLSVQTIHGTNHYTIVLRNGSGHYHRQPDGQFRPVDRRQRRTATAPTVSSVGDKRAAVTWPGREAGPVRRPIAAAARSADTR